MIEREYQSDRESGKKNKKRRVLTVVSQNSEVVLLYFRHGASYGPLSFRWYRSCVSGFSPVISAIIE